MVILYGIPVGGYIPEKPAATYIPFPGLTCDTCRDPYFRTRPDCLCRPFFVLGAYRRPVRGCSGSPLCDRSQSRTFPCPLALAPADARLYPSSAGVIGGEMSTLAKDLGWQQGYVTVYSTGEQYGRADDHHPDPHGVFQYEHNRYGLPYLFKRAAAEGARLFRPCTASKRRRHRAFSAVPVNATSTVTSGVGAGFAGSSGTAPAEGYMEVIFVRDYVLK